MFKTFITNVKAKKQKINYLFYGYVFVQTFLL